MKNNFYITTTLAYINSRPHIGFAAELIKADVMARYQRLLGKEVFFNTGTDEHGQKIWQKAQEQGMEIKEFCDQNSRHFIGLKEALNISWTSFIRTTDKEHKEAAREFWRLCAKNGDIYKKLYKIKYCVGCELEKTDSELPDGKCPLHPNQEIENIEEENYFFRWSKYQDKLLKLYKDNPDFVVPNHRMNEIRNFVEAGLQDFSISRLKEKMPWGVPVPGDPDHVMYVWFDALVNYISALGWPLNKEAGKSRFQEFWPGIQVAGKDNLRQQSAMWQAMLMSAGPPNSKQILIFGFITSNGQKMSKSLGNTVSPGELVEKYGAEAVRYYLLSEIPVFEDGDFSYEKFETRYNADLANGLGNLTARVAKLLEKNKLKINLKINSDKKLAEKIGEAMDKYRFDQALKILWDVIRKNDEYLSAKAPWKIKDKTEMKKILEPAAQAILNIGYLLQPFLPATAEKIITQFSAKQITKEESLFPRL